MEQQSKMDMFDIFPEECMSQIINLTAPRDASRLSVVSPAFKSAADSDGVWEKFLPSEYKDIISNSDSSSLLTTCMSKKNLFQHLCDNPIIINNGAVLNATWGSAGDVPMYWILPSQSDSRFAEVAKFGPMWYFEVKGGMETKLLSPKTIYGTYLVFKFHDLERRILYKEDPPVKCGVYFEGKDDGKRHSLFLDPAGSMLRRYRDKGDGWMEIEMGEFFNENGHDGMLMFTFIS
ncbi:hypothetical protein Pint_25364 [Pistacia integerrima]|uniref:Uncharacterized protein n=1 Tax=Pistacia integerrima TaxID=434235 RepID=A0ACC0YA78_9ROSI|nr:hypothetical protein Pint_25364 [Pistacia integerrima]